MGSKEFIALCKKHVVDYFNENADKTDRKRISEDDVFVVWSCKLYFDAYKKWQNICFEVKE